MKIPEIKLCKDLASSEYDGVIVVGPSVSHVQHPALKKALQAVAEIDKSADGGCFVAACPELPAKRVVYSSTGKLDEDIDDVRRFGEAVEKGINRARQAGCKNPVVTLEGHGEFGKSKLVSLLGAFTALYVPLEVREDVPAKAVKMDKIGVFDADGTFAQDAKLAAAIEDGKFVARDIGGSDPERMAPPR